MFTLICISQTLMEDEPEKYQSQFSEYIKKGIEADNIEELLKKVHAAIRAEPLSKKTQKQPPKEHKRLIAKLYLCLWIELSFQFLVLCVLMWFVY